VVPRALLAHVLEADPVESLRHPFSKSQYDRDEDGNIRVTTPDGRIGVFTDNGVWVGGEKVDVDPQLCVWIRRPRSRHPRLG
jgi:hypothetical protein